jgi:hypothetical protein
VVYDKDRKVIKEKNSLGKNSDLLQQFKVSPSDHLATHEDESQEIIYLDPRRFLSGRMDISVKGKHGSSYEVTEGAPDLPVYSDVISGNGSYEVSIPFSMYPQIGGFIYTLAALPLNAVITNMQDLGETCSNIGPGLELGQYGKWSGTYNGQTVYVFVDLSGSINPAFPNSSMGALTPGDELLVTAVSADTGYNNDCQDSNFQQGPWHKSSVIG